MKIVRKILKYFKRLTICSVSYVLLLLPINEKKVVFMSDTRETLGGNLKCMYDYLSDEYIKVEILKSDRRTKRSFKEKIKMFLNLATAKYIFLEDLVQITSYFVFSKNQELIQLWHGPGAFKKFGYSRLLENGGDLQKVHKGYKKYTKAIVSGEGIRKDYAEAFGISIDKVYATGFLRTDIFFDEKYIKKTRKKLFDEYPNLKNKKIILFAPTYRGTPYRNVENGGAYYDFNKIDFKKIYEELSDEYIFIFKWHPALYNNIKNGQVELPNLSDYKDFYYDFSEYRDINDLLLVTDVLITDYSSVIFDYLLVDKPLVYFAYDKDDYVNGRGLYYDFEDYLYGEVSVNTSQLIKYIKLGNMLPEKRKKFRKQFMSACDGNSTKKTYDLLFK